MESTMETPYPEKHYPLTFSVDYPDRELNRLSTFFRVFAIIPIAFVLATVSGGQYSSGTGDTATYIAAAGGILFFGPLLMLLFRKKYPAWWSDWNRELLRFSNRVYVYLYLMDDTYPSTDEHQAVHLDFARTEQPIPATPPSPSASGASTTRAGLPRPSRSRQR